MTNYVPPTGPTNARIALVGEAPGQDEVSKGEPFVGPSGRLLNDMLASAGIARSECYLTNVVKQRPPGNDFGVFYVDKQRRQPSPLLQTSIYVLRSELQQVHPNIIVPLGDEALRAITGRQGITKWRGSLLPTSMGKCCPTLHPAYVIRQYLSRTTVELDLRRVAKESTSPELVLPTHQFSIAPSFDEVLAYLSHVPEYLSFDIETSGPHVRCLGLSTRPDHAICIPFMAAETVPVNNIVGGAIQTPTRNSYWTEEQEYQILLALDNLFRNPLVKKIAQNFPFDALILSKEFGLDTSIDLWMDTMVAHHCCYSELPKGLDYLVSVYTRIPYYSDFDNSSDRSTWVYNCYDAAGTLEVALVLEKELADCGQHEFYHNHIQPSLIAYTRAETRGVLIDEEVRTPLRDQTRSELAVLEQQIIAKSGGIIKNPNSDDQIKEYLYGALQLKPVLNHKTKQPTSDKNAREQLMARHPEHIPILEQIDEYSKKSSLCSRLLDRPLGGDGRIRTHYNMAKTVTGRLASTEPLFDVGTNLQNIDKGELRRLFIADPGFVLIKADLSQAEFRIVVWKARIRRIIDKYLTNPNFDVHRMIASLIFDKSEELIDKKERGTAKNGVYGGQYKMWYVTAARTYHLPIDVARFVLDKFHTLFPEIRQNFWADVEREILSTRVLENPLGRRRIFLDRMDDDLFRSAYSHFAQSLVGDIINRAFSLADALWNPSEAWPLLQVHDEIVAAAREDKAAYYGNHLRQLMEYPVQIDGTPEPLIIPAEVSIGRDWYNQKILERN